MRICSGMGHRISGVAALLAVVVGTVVVARPAFAGSPASERLRHIEQNAIELPGSGGQPSTKVSLSELMKTFHVPALSIAIIENFKIVDVKAYGVVSPESQAPVTTKTLFQAGSISKPVAATAALYLVEQGKLSLDEDVNAKLKTWKVPQNEFTATDKVTLRRLMSHTAGLTVHGFPGYDIDAPRPSIVQVLNGEPPANTAPIRVDIVPGTKSRYSGGGVTIEQLLMTDVSGKPFPAFMRETVLDKLGMTDSSYEQPLPPARAAMTAGGAYSDGKPVHGKWHVYPEMAAAGLWTTPTDLAKFAIEIGLSRQGKSNRVLSQKMTQEMLTPVMDDVGLGFFLEKDNPGCFGHSGADEGFQAFLAMCSETGNGLVMMANSDNGIALMTPIFRRVAAEYAWPNYKIRPDIAGNLFLLATIKGISAGLAHYDDLKKSPTGASAPDETTLNALGYRLLFSDKTADAVKVFEKNVQEYPNSSNVYDSLGEAYMKSGQKDLAIQNYERSLQLDPKNNNAVEQLKKLRGEMTSPKIMQQEGFTVVGISARTTNAKEMSGEGVIGKQWQRLLQDALLEKIPNKADHNIVTVYTDYASDHNGEYTYILGARVTSDANVPEGMVAKKIPAQKLAMFTSAKGPAPKVIPELWLQINSLPASAPGGDRLYLADYEIYDQRAADPNNMQVDAYIGIK